MGMVRTTSCTCPMFSMTSDSKRMPANCNCIEGLTVRRTNSLPYRLCPTNPSSFFLQRYREGKPKRCHSPHSEGPSLFDFAINSIISGGKNRENRGAHHSGTGYFANVAIGIASKNGNLFGRLNEYLK